MRSSYARTSATIALAALLAAACTGGDEGDPDAGGQAGTVDTVADDADGTADDEAAPAGYALELEEVDADLADLAGFDLPDETFSPTGVELINNRFVIYGSYETPTDPEVPAVFEASATDRTSWSRTDLELPDPYLTGWFTLTSDRGRWVTHLRTEDGQQHAALWVAHRPPRLDTVIDTADTVTVSDVASIGAPRWLAVGSVREDDGERRPAAWITDRGEVEEVQLPTDGPLGSSEARLTAAARHDGTLTVFGYDRASRQVFMLQGEDVEDLELVDLPDVFDRVESVDTLLSAHDALWVGGADRGSGGGQQAVWSYTDGTWADHTDLLWGDRTRPTSSASRLTSGRWGPYGDRYVGVANGARTWWWTLRSGEITETGQFGGTMAAYSDMQETAVTFDSWDQSFAVDFEDAEVDLPPTPSVAGRPWIGAATGDVVAVGSGTGEDVRTVLVDLSTSEAIGDVLGSVWLPELTEGELAIGQRRVDGTITATMVSLDDEPTDVDLRIPEDSVTSRLQAVVETGDGLLALGHAWVGGTPQTLAALRDEDGAWSSSDPPSGIGEGRGVSHGCGPQHVVTFDEQSTTGIAWVDGPDTAAEVVLETDSPFHALQGCVTDAADRVWVVTVEHGVATIDRDGEVGEHGLIPGLVSLHGMEAVEVGGQRHVVALGTTRLGSYELTAWITSDDDPTGWTRTDPVAMPAGVSALDIVGLDGERLLLGGRIGGRPHLWSAGLVAR